MSITINNDNIKDVYKGSIKIAKIFKGSELLYLSQMYPAGTVLFENSAAGTYTLNVTKQTFADIILVGGGGGGATSSWSSGNGSGAGGGSGGYSKIEKVLIEAGEYTVVVGAGGSRATAFEHTRATAGTGGTSSFMNYTAEGGTGGDCALQAGIVIAGTGGVGLTQNGNNGNAGTGYNTTFTGGASVYNGYGKGGNGCATNPGGSLIGNTTNGGNGYVKIITR